MQDLVRLKVQYSSRVISLTLAEQSPTAAASSDPSLLNTALDILKLDPELLPEDEVREGPCERERSNSREGVMADDDDDRTENEANCLPLRLYNYKEREREKDNIKNKRNNKRGRKKGRQNI